MTCKREWEWNKAFEKETKSDQSEGVFNVFRFKEQEMRKRILPNPKIVR